MPLLKKDAPQDLKDTLLSVEQRADECYKFLRLLKRPANEARWALLTAMALVLETSQQRFGANTSKHDIAMVKLDRCTCGFRFITEHGRIASRLVKNYTWHGSLVEDANHALHVTEQYGHFLNVFPMWHKHHEQVDLLPDGRVRFYMPRDSPRQRQVVSRDTGRKELTSFYPIGAVQKPNPRRRCAYSGNFGIKPDRGAPPENSPTRRQAH